MKLHLTKWLLLGALAVVPIGCETNTVVDDDPDGTTVVEDDGVDTVVVPNATPPAETGTRDSVDVNINPPSTPPAQDTNNDQNSSSSPNANQ